MTQKLVEKLTAEAKAQRMTREQVVDLVYDNAAKLSARQYNRVLAQVLQAVRG